MKPVAKTTISAGFQPNPGVLAFDRVVLSDLATPCDVFERVRDSEGRPRYDVRVCGVRRNVKSEHLSLEVPWKVNTMQRAGTIIVPGIDPIESAVSDELIQALRRAAHVERA